MQLGHVEELAVCSRLRFPMSCSLTVTSLCLTGNQRVRSGGPGRKATLENSGCPIDDQARVPIYS